MRGRLAGLRRSVDTRDAVAACGLACVAGGLWMEFSAGIALIVIGVVALGAVAWGAR